MKRILSLIVLAYLLAGCSLFERKPEDPNEPPFPPNDSAGTAEAASEGAENAEAPPPAAKAAARTAQTGADSTYMENEIARLNAKVEALETKLTALSDNMQTQKDHRAQPQLRAEPAGDEESPPTTNASQDTDPDAEPTHARQIMATRKLPNAVKASSTPVLADKEEVEEAAPNAKSSGSVEKDFQTAMQYFNSNKFKEAANQFLAITKANRSHPLASHALYWAGESAAHAHNWKVAIHHWTNLENNYPRSVYIPDTLAGLSTAYAADSNAEKAKHYRETLVKAFPDSPATANATTNLTEAEEGN